MKGISHKLLKVSAKRRRSKAQIEEEKQTAAQQKAEVEHRLSQMDKMSQEMAELRQQIAMAEQMHSQVQQMFDDGILKQGDDGSYQPVFDAEESERIKSATKTRRERAQMTQQELDKLNQDLDKMSN